MSTVQKIKKINKKSQVVFDLRNKPACLLKKIRGTTYNMATKCLILNWAR